mmetsp:Transcript_100358/g.199101  ORF Transcript_100358/g.199101 Transcript_100358/m.199101 type:complete len:597 (+) Transcript_100358:83-1873(+)
MRTVLLQVTLLLPQLAASLRDEMLGTKMRAEVVADCEPHERMSLTAVLPKGRFQRVSCLGYGSFGTVFSAEDTHHKNLPVALKVAPSSSKKKTCNHECEIIQHMMRTCTPPIHDNCRGSTHIMRCLEQNPVGSQGDWMVMELGGKALATVFQAGLGPQWNIALLKSFVAQLVEAFEFMRRQHVAHGDFLEHWGNMVVADLYANPKIKIVDFGRASTGGAESTNSVIGHYFWHLMHLPLDFLPSNCIAKFTDQLQTLLGGTDGEPRVTADAHGSGTSVDGMVTLLIEANDKSGWPNTLRSAAKRACHVFNGQEWGPLLTSLQPVTGEYSTCSENNLPKEYCTNNMELHRWLLEHWNTVCTRLGPQTCELKPARDIATFIVAFWSFMFDAYDSLNSHWDACGPCYEMTGGTWCRDCKVREHLKEMFPDGTIDCLEDVDEVDAEYFQGIDCKVTPSGGVDLVARKVCSRLCDTSNNTDSVKSVEGQVKGQPCCVVTEESSKLTQEDWEESEWPSLNLDIIKAKVTDAKMDAFPNRDVRNAKLLELWSGILTDPAGLSFLDLLLNREPISSQHSFLKGALPEANFDKRMESYPKSCSEGL